MSIQDTYLVACGVICIYPLIGAVVGVLVYRAWTSGRLTWRKK